MMAVLFRFSSESLWFVVTPALDECHSEWGLHVRPSCSLLYTHQVSWESCVHLHFRKEFPSSLKLYVLFRLRSKVYKIHAHVMSIGQEENVLDTYQCKYIHLHVISSLQCVIS